MRFFNLSLILLIIFIIMISAVQVISQERASTNSDTVSSNSGTVAPDKAKQDGNTRDADSRPGFTGKTIFTLFNLAKEIVYLLIFAFILGMLFISQQWLVLRREKNDALKIPIEQVRTMSYEDIRSMFTKISEVQESDTEQEKIPLLKRIFRRKKASAFQLLYKLFKIFDSQKSTGSFNEETSNFVQYLKDMFNTFLTRLSFLSDTAGALGLLGTVWGMFLVFYKGSPDQSEILAGMGIALSTTIIGLVISIFLNSFTTVVSNFFDRHLDRINKMATIFQERLMKEEVKQPIPIVVSQTAQPTAEQQKVVVPQPEVVSQQEKEIIKAEEPPAVEFRTPTIIYGPPAEIKIISGDNQTGEVNSLLPEPIIVEVRDKNGHLLENETAVFNAEDGAGTFLNKSRIHKILTDEEGRAKTQLLLGNKAGEKTIRIKVDGSDIRGVTSIIKAKPTPPTKFIELDGNYQTSELNKRLLKPFTVAIKDKYDNPIPRHEITFNLRKGSGKFQDSQNSRYTAFTNEDGLAEVYFIMGNDRGAREIEAEAKKVEPSKIGFEIFGI